MVEKKVKSIERWKKTFKRIREKYKVSISCFKINTNNFIVFFSILSKIRNMNFEQKLTSLLKDEKFIEHSGTYGHDFLKKLFLENISNNLEIFIREIAIKLHEQETWSFINFLRTVYEDNQSEFSLEDKEKIWIFIKDWLYSSSTHDDTYTSLLRLFSILPTEKTELTRLSKYILENRKAYTTLEALSFDLSKLIPDEKIFLEVFLTTLNAPRGSYLWLAWHEKFWEIIAKHPERKWFFDQLLIDVNKDAADEFLSKWKKAWEALLNSLDDNKTTIKETITFFRDFFTKLSPNRTWYGHESNKAKELLGLVLNYAQKNNISFHSDLPFLFDEKTFWHTEDILAQHISEKDILEFYKKVEFKEMHLFRIYESIKYWKREDKEKLLQIIEWFEWFDKKLKEVELARENGKKQSEASTKKFHEKIKREIRNWSNNTDEDKISPRLLEYFFREDYNKLFTKKYREEAIKQLKRFLGWNLFNLDVQVYERYTEDNGKIDYRWGYWYSVEFFTQALEAAKELNINIKTRKIQNSIVRSLLLYDTSDLTKLYEKLWRDITDKEANLILTVLQKEHISNARYHLSGQNIFPVFEKYEKIFLRKKHREKIIELFKSIITDEDFEEWRRASPLDHLNWELYKEMLPWLKSHWENIVDKKRNYIETFDRWGLVLKLNTILIRENDDEAIRWRLKQLQSAKVKSLSFDDRRKWQSGGLHFRWVSDIESELDFDKTLIKWLKNIDARKYQKELLNAIKHGLNLLKEEEKEETKLLSSYARYLISGVFSIESFIYEDLITLAESLIKKFSWEAKKIWLWSISNAKQALVEKIMWEWISHEIKIEKSPTENESQITPIELKKTRKELKETKKNLEDKKEELRIKEEEMERYNQQEEYLRNIWDNIIFIEGFTGVQHLEKAWEVLRWTKVPFKIEDGFDWDHIKKLLLKPQEFKKKKIIGIYDLDGKWLSRWVWTYIIKEDKKDPWSKYESVRKFEDWKCLYKKADYKWEMRCAITLPLINDFSQNLSELGDFRNIYLEWTKENSEIFNLDIEHMFYHIHPNIDNKFFKKNWEFNWKKATFLWDLLKFAETLKLPTWEKIDLKELFKNFEPLLVQIEEIVEIWEKSPE